MGEILSMPGAVAQKVPNPATVGRLPKGVVRPYELVWRRSRREEASRRAERQVGFELAAVKHESVRTLRAMLTLAEAGELRDFVAIYRLTNGEEDFAMTGHFFKDYQLSIAALRNTADRLADAL